MENATPTAQRPDWIHDLSRVLAAHPEFRVLPVKNNPSAPRSAAMIGNMLASIASVRSIATFDRAISLLWHRTCRNSGRFEVDLFWHVRRISGDWWVFLHGVDSEGNIAFQDDFSLAGATPSPFGFLYTRRSIALPPEIAQRRCTLRLGLWIPSEARQLSLTRLRGFARESGGWYNAVSLNFRNS